MKFDVYNTHMELSPYKLGDYPEIEELYTAIDPFTMEFFPCGYIIENNTLFLPRGTPIDFVERVTKTKARFVRRSDPSKDMVAKHYPTVEPRDKLQEKTIQFLTLPDKQLSVTLRTGFGKGIPVDAKIPTPSGMRRMGDIKVGDMVFGSNGRPTEVMAVYNQGEQECYRVTFTDGRSVECDENHLWWVASRKSSHSRYRTMNTKELLEDLHTYMPSVIERDGVHRNPFIPNWKIPLLSGPVEFEHRDVPIDPYVMGAFIGNGCLRESQLSLSSGNEFVPKRVAELMGCVCMKISKYNYTYQFYDQYDGHKIRTADFFKDYPELMTYSRHKVIPDEYMYNDIPSRIDLLRGLFDTDGSISMNERHDILFTSTSEKLLKQIQELIWGLGFICRDPRPDKRSDKYVEGYCGSLSVRVPQWFKPQLFLYPAKRDRAVDAANSKRRVSQKFTHLIIGDIVPIGKKETVCIRVAARDQLFLMDKFIVTHNTVVTALSCMKLGKKTIIITPDEGLKKQWIKCFEDMMDINSDQMLNIASSDIMKSINNGKLNTDNVDVFFVNHQTLRSFFVKYGPRAFTTFFRKIKVGIKVYDEAHKEFHNILLIDSYTNTERTWYLTATFDRSEKSESRCFKTAFSSVYEFGNEESIKAVPPHTIYHLVNINSMITPANRKKVMGWNGMSVASYGRYAFKLNPKDTATKTIIEIIEKLKKVEGKVLVLVPLIESVDKVWRDLQKAFPDKIVTRYHSKVHKDEKKDAFDADIIVSTLKSSGTGRDIKGLRTVINAEPLASKVNAEQMIGRLRPYYDKDGKQLDTLFFDIVDTCIPPVVWWWKARFKRIRQVVKEVITLDR